MKYLLLAFAGFLFFSPAMAQKDISVKGIIKSNENQPMGEVSVILYYPGKTDTLRTITNDKGAFSFSNVSPAKLVILATHVGYKAFINSYDYSKETGVQNIWDITMSPGDNTLEGITLEASKIQIKEDTVSYKVDSTMYRKNDNVEEVLKKLPGVEVDKEGKVTAQGKEVTKVKVNGKEFFGGDVTTATRQLNADMVDRLDIIDDYGDQSAFTGVRDGEPSKTLNIQLKKDKNKGYFGNGSVGVGTEGRYMGSASVNYFNNNKQISVIGNINNTNASTFNFGSMGQMGATMAGMGRSMMIGRVGNFSGFGNNDGLSLTKSLGVNFRDQWGTKVTGYGSYSISNRDTRTISNISRQNIFKNSTNTNLQDNIGDNNSTNHRLSFNIEYKIDSFNYIKVSPNLSYRSSDENNFTDFAYLDADDTLTSKGTNNSISNSTSPNLSGNILFNHRFAKRGRTLSVNLSAGASTSESDEDYQNRTTFYLANNQTRDSVLYQYINQDNENRNASVRASYIEPLSKKKSLEFNYTYSHQFINNDRENFLVNPGTGQMKYSDSLSNIFENVYDNNRFGANYRVTEKKYNYSIGMAVQPANITTNSITGKARYSQNVVNYFPVVRYSYKFSRSRAFNINYNGSSNQPSVQQLQPVTDLSNRQYITVGNPDLRPEFNNRLSLQYNNFDFVSGNVFFGTITGSYTNDKIVSNVFDRGNGVQETRYLNSDGYFNVMGFYTISKPIKNRKYVFTLGGNVNYNNNISFLADKRNTGRNWITGQRFAFDYKLKKWLETNFTTNFSLNSSNYSLQKQLNSTSTAWVLSHNSRLFLPKGFVLSYDVEKTFNNGLANSVSTDPLIINANLEKQFFEKKNFSLRLQAFDMLNENTNVSRSVTATAITDSRTNRLGRYYMLSAIFRINKFTGQASGTPGRRVMIGAPGVDGM